jgi:hypothetical protein
MIRLPFVFFVGSSGTAGPDPPQKKIEKGAGQAPFAGTLEKPDYFFIRRRAQKASPARPMPRRSSVEGSGTAKL